MNPASGHLYENAVMAYRAGKREEASELCWQAICRDRGHADAWALRGRIEADAGRWANAVLHTSQALTFAPDRYDLWNNMGIDACGARMYRESREAYEKSLALQETYNAHFNYGNLLSALMELDGAEKHFLAARKIGGAAEPQIHANLGTVMIALGHWRPGFQAYRNRFNAPGFPPRPNFKYPIWQGEPLKGKTILLYVEQGFGDEIQSYRFAKPIKDMGARVIMTARAPLYRLARSFEYADAVIMQYDPPPWQPDYMCALLDVPAWCDITPDNVPLPGGYLKPRDEGFDLTFPPGLNVGICWASGKRAMQPSMWETAKIKSLSFDQLAPLARPGVNLVCLQQTHDNKQDLAALGVHDPMMGVADFYDTAWIVSQLDLVITVDTSVSHLAGALGKPVWNLVRFDALWPWGTETGKTCWYDSMKIYRQPAPFDWKEPLKRLMADFDRLVSERAKAAA